MRERKFQKSGDNKKNFSKKGRDFKEKDDRKSFSKKGRDFKEKDDRKSFSKKGRDFKEKDDRKSFSKKSRDFRERVDKRSFSKKSHDFQERDDKRSFSKKSHDFQERNDKRSFSKKSHDFQERDDKRSFSRKSRDFQERDDKRSFSRKSRDFQERDDKRSFSKKSHDFQEKKPFFDKDDKKSRDFQEKKFFKDKKGFSKKDGEFSNDIKSKKHDNIDDERFQRRGYGLKDDRWRNHNYERKIVRRKRTNPFKKTEGKNEENIEKNLVRLNKFVSNSGVCSRREADDYIKSGLVKVNKKVVSEMGSKIDPDIDEIRFNDKIIKTEKKVYLVLNKPKNFVTTLRDPFAEKTVMDLVKIAGNERIYPVGRLDKTTTGVLFFTNDGDLAKNLMHPKYHHKRIYHVFLNKNLKSSDMMKIAEGLDLEDGYVRIDEISYADEKDKSQIGLEIHSGKNRIVRRIFEHLGYKVKKLDRVYFAGLTKKNLSRGKWRFLTEREISRFKMKDFS